MTRQGRTGELRYFAGLTIEEAQERSGFLLQLPTGIGPMPDVAVS